MKNLPDTAIIDNCTKKTEQKDSMPFCFEMFRRAIEENNEACWCTLIVQYYNLVLYWVRHLEKKYYTLLPDEIESVDIVQIVFLNFRETYKENNFKQAKGLSSVLQYLKKTTITTVLGIVRQTKRRLYDLPYDDMIKTHSNQEMQPATDGQLIVDDIWMIIKTVCQNDKELIIVDAYLKRDMKPRHIFEFYGDIFESIEEINKIKRNVWARLRRNLDLIEMCKK